MDFISVTDQLISKRANLLTRVALKLGVSEQILRQSRVSPYMQAARRPPPGWERAVLAVAQEHLAEYQDFVRGLECQLLEKRD